MDAYKYKRVDNLLKEVADGLPYEFAKDELDAICERNESAEIIDKGLQEPNTMNTHDSINKECPECGGIMCYDADNDVIYCLDCGYIEDGQIKE